MILACRSTTKGEAIKELIESSVPLSPGIVEVWPLDLCSFESVKEFCRRAVTTLDRIDVVLANAAVMMHKMVQAPDAGGFETTIATNVVSTLLMALMLLPKMRTVAAQHNVTPCLTFVVSDAHCFVTSRISSAPGNINYPVAGRIHGAVGARYI